MSEEDLLTAAQPLIDAALREDWGERGDITGRAVGSDRQTDAVIIAKRPGVLCGCAIAAHVFLRTDATLVVEPAAHDGERLAAGQIILRLQGSAQSILAAERTALNFLGRLSGIATLTRRFVDAVLGTSCRILDTRKTTPGWRALEKYAVRCGGGVNHRLGLYDMFLIKENHIAAAGGIAKAVEACRAYMNRYGFKAAIEVEARTLEDVAEAAALGVDRIMLDNMPLEVMRQAVQLADGRVPLEASGNVTLENVRQVALTGVDFISVGALTHSAPVLDLSLLFAQALT
ncbi:MAG: carboxylating nicotinate-nucleotide diphosphorylase [candidate division KSB1 bacterium]|nr:carboxylating nicotinate-nucleotide diphosphorylase [candidate division KSB1 bacterium]